MGAFAHSDAALSQWIGLWKNLLQDDFPIQVGLYINDYTPVPGWVIGDITECNLSDYSRQNIDNTPWGQGMVAHVAIITAPNAVVFTTADFTGQLCYGYFVFDSSSGNELWVQRFDAPQLLVNGVPISFTIRDKLKDCPD